MWLFSKRPTKEGLQSYKDVSVLGMRFTIRRVSPLADLDPSALPAIFTDTTRRQAQDLSSVASQRRALDDMKMIVQAGVVDPPLSGPGKPGLSVDDVFRDMDLGTKLYWTILEHSLFKVSPWKVPFFFS